MPGEEQPEDSQIRVLVVDDEAVARNMLGRILSNANCTVDRAASGEQAIEQLGQHAYDVMLVDLVLGGLDGLAVLQEARRHDPEVAVIVMTGHGSVDTAIEAMKRGAFHYLQKPLRPDEVRNLVQQAGQRRLLERRVRELEQEVQSAAPCRIVGKSAAMETIRALIWQIRTAESNVLITGESGTGKELVARAIHASSRRAAGRFVAFNCASLNDELLCNELFGHEKDAYTGATAARAGLLEAGQGGTVFFDEVGDMSIAMQSKLLRAVQEREVLRVGGTRPIPVDIRIVAATNKDLRRLISAGVFREDLFYRLNVISIDVPPLAQRSEDIPLLAMHFLRTLEQRTGKRLRGYSSEALELLLRYRYPGNVRELENIVERAACLATGTLIEAQHLPPDMTAPGVKTFRYDAEPIKTLEALEEEYVQWVLEQVGHNKTKAARLLGIDRVSLYRRLRKHEITE